MHALTVRLIDPLVMTTVHCLLREAAATAEAMPTIAATTTATTTTATAGMGVEMGDGCIQTTPTSPRDLAVTTVLPLNSKEAITTTTTLHLHPHLRPFNPSVGLSLTAFETALALNMRLLAHSPAAPGG